MIACRTLAETHSLNTTVARMMMKIIVTWGQARMLSDACGNGFGAVLAAAGLWSCATVARR